MHELGITRNIVAIATEYCEGAKVRRVVVKIGQLSAIVPDAIRFCFDVCCQGTPLEGAILEIREIPGRASCCECGREIPLTKPFGSCTCGSERLDIFQGEELTVEELELEKLSV
ncbi:MAG: hydrogenase maturation nickel metallochaperone HypA [Prochloraceae cyanobacterium]|nr:hydrogenase maturation nickel metallochaperone HypA [Prochloraceae cyanobacterium]